jgi:hypothetical protein
MFLFFDNHACRGLFHFHVFYVPDFVSIVLSPTGGLVIPLSATRFAVMAAATAESQYFYHIVPEEKPYLF